MKVKSESEVAQSCLILGDSMDCSLPGSSIHGIFQVRVLEWGAIAFSILQARSDEILVPVNGAIAFLMIQIKDSNYRFPVSIPPALYSDPELGEAVLLWEDFTGGVHVMPEVSIPPPQTVFSEQGPLIF